MWEKVLGCELFTYSLRNTPTHVGKGLRIYAVCKGFRSNLY